MAFICSFSNYFSKELFGTLEAGVHFLRVTADIYDVYSEEKISTDYEAKYGGGIGAGYRYRLSEPSVFEISGAYQIVQDDFNSVAVRLGILVLRNGSLVEANGAFGFYYQ